MTVLGNEHSDFLLATSITSVSITFLLELNHQTSGGGREGCNQGIEGTQVSAVPLSPLCRLYSCGRVAGL